MLDPGENVRWRWRSRIVMVVVVAVLSAIGFGAWRMLLWRPSPEALCDHHEELHAMPRIPESLEICLEKPPWSRTSRQQCEWYYGAMRRCFSWMRYGRVARCVMSADRYEDTIGCDTVE